MIKHYIAAFLAAIILFGSTVPTVAAPLVDDYTRPAAAPQSPRDPSGSMPSPVANGVVSPVAATEPASPAPATSPAAGAAPTAKPSPSPSASPAAPARRAKPQPFESIYPLTEYLGPTIGVPRDTTQYPLMKALGLDGDKVWGGFRLYGWINPAAGVSTSRNSTYPQTYLIASNQAVLDQAILRFEKQVDTAQTDHFDWGFELSNMYGIDYRWTTAKGWLSQQLLNNNRYYGYDPVECNFQMYFPKIAQGTVVTLGRFISPADIEAQLAPQNLLYTHSVFFDYDAYTQTGVKAEVKFNDTWSAVFAIHAGDDTAPWAAGAHVTGECMLRWVSDNNKDSLLFGIDALNSGEFTHQKDNLQQANINYSHKFNDWIMNQFEMYLLWSHNALFGGTVNNGPIQSFGPFGGGPGPLLPGWSTASGFTNYTNFKVDDKSYVSLRESLMNDPRGWRSGFVNTYGEITLGYVRHLTDTTTIRPEIRWDHAFQNPAYDNGTKTSQWSLNMDLIQYF